MLDIHINKDMNINIHIDINMNIGITPPQPHPMLGPSADGAGVGAWWGGISIFTLISI